MLGPHSVARDWMVGTGMPDRDLPVVEANPQNRDMASKAGAAGGPQEPGQANREPFLNAKPALLDNIRTNLVCALKIWKSR